MREVKVFILLTLMALVGCRDKELDMTVVEKPLCPGADIEALEVSGAWNVTVVLGAEQNCVELEYSAFLEDYLRVGKEGNSLSIGFTPRLNLPASTVKNATVHVPSLREFTLKGASTVVLDGTLAATSFDVDLQDASVLRGGRFAGNFHAVLDNASSLVDLDVEADSCLLSLSGLSVVKGTFTASEFLEINADGASRVTTYGGEAPTAKVVLDEASFLNLLETDVNDLTIQMQQASEASVKVNHRIEGLVRNASTLYYQGNPILDVDCDDTSFIYYLSPLNSQLSILN